MERESLHLERSAALHEHTKIMALPFMPAIHVAPTIKIATATSLWWIRSRSEMVLEMKECREKGTLWGALSKCLRKVDVPRKNAYFIPFMSCPSGISIPSFLASDL